MTFTTSSRFAVSAGISASIVLIALTLAGCGSQNAATPANFRLGLDKYFAEGQRDCLLPNQNHFPYETSSAAERKQLDALVKSQLLTVKVEDPVARYQTTDYGAAFAPRFCFGYRQTVSVDGYTPLKKSDGFFQSTVSYHYSMRDVPVWARSGDMKQAFPALAAATSGNATAQTTMAQTAVGWQVPE